MKIRKVVALVALCLLGICGFQVKAEESIKFAGIDICGPNYEKLIDKLQKDGFELVESTEKANLFLGEQLGHDVQIIVNRAYKPERIQFVTLEFEEMPLREVSGIYTNVCREFLSEYSDYNLFILFDEDDCERHMLMGQRGSITFGVKEKNNGKGVLCISYLNSEELQRGTENKQGIGTDDL